MLPAFLRSAALAVARSRLGRRYAAFAFRADVRQWLELVSQHFNTSASFRTDLPELKKISGFEDLYWLFSSNLTNWGIIAMDLAEATYLYRLAKSLRHAQCLEIGRFKGGSTFLLAAAIGDDSQLVSIDNHSKLQNLVSGAELDRSLHDALVRFGLDGRVVLQVGDSGTVPLEPQSLELAFIDGDHSYEGVSRDFQNVRRAMKPGGHVLFHDAVQGGPYATVHEGVNRLVREIQTLHGEHFTWKGQSGTLAHFVRTGKTYE